MVLLASPRYRNLGGSVWSQSLPLRPARVVGVGEALPANVLASTRCDERPSRRVFGDLEPQLLDCLSLLVHRLHAPLPRGEGTNGIPGRRGAHHPQRPSALGRDRRGKAEQAAERGDRDESGALGHWRSLWYTLES